MRKKIALLISLIFFGIFLFSLVSINSFENTNGLKIQAVENTSVSSSGVPSTSWRPNGIGVCTEDNKQDSPQICCDGTGGAIIVWQDYNRSGDNTYDIYAQRITKNGMVAWTSGGVIISNAQGHQYLPEICCNGSGSIIIVWVDQRKGDMDIFAQKIDLNGVTQWDLNGTLICNASSDQSNLQICCDQTGGAYITWQDERGPDRNIYAQRISSSGLTQWDDNGIVICNASEHQNTPKICCNETGGAFITWYDYRNGGVYADIYAQLIDLDGNAQWTKNGTVICNASYSQLSPQICCDPAGGAIIIWRDYRNNNDYNVYAQKIGLNEVLQWTTNGIVICNAEGNQNEPQICCDGAGGAIIAWSDYREVTHSDLYAQRVDSDGNTYWGNATPGDKNGTPICKADGSQFQQKICCYGNNSAIVVWMDGRNEKIVKGIANSDIYAQLVNSKGKVQWGKNGRRISTRTQQYEGLEICCDRTRARSVILVWADPRHGLSNPDIFAQKIIDTVPSPLPFLYLMNRPQEGSMLLIMAVIIIAAVAAFIILYLKEKQ